MMETAKIAHPEKQVILRVRPGFAVVKPLDPLYPGSDGYILTKLKELIELHYKEAHAIGFYTTRLNTSLSTLNRLTRRLTGKNAYDLLQDRLHQEAVTLLLHTSLTFKQISNVLCVCDPAYFSRCFKQKTGLCPREFRKMNK